MIKLEGYPSRSGDLLIPTENWHFEGDNEVRLVPIINDVVHHTNL